jgi:hypothetical protein
MAPEFLASALAKLGAVGFIMIFVVIAGLMALFPQATNRARMKLPGQGESPDWYIRLLGIVIGGFAFVLAGLIVFLAK